MRSRRSISQRSAARGRSISAAGSASLAPGHDADLVVLDPKATPLLAFRSQQAKSIQEMLAILMTLGDDRAVKATYAAGHLAHQRSLTAAG